MAAKPKCLYCGKPSALLCDFIMGFRGKPGELAQGATLHTHTCDAHLCAACAVRKGHFHWHGGGRGGYESIDWCPDHPEEGIEWLQHPMSDEEAQRLRHRHRCQAGPGLHAIQGGGQRGLFDL